jgi:hypothetical protein
MAGIAQHYTSFSVTLTGFQLIPDQRRGPANHDKTRQASNGRANLRESLPAHVPPISCSIQNSEQPRSECTKARTQPRQFPYIEVAKLWEEGKTISEMAHAIARFEDNKKDPCHSLRNFLRVMHQQGYVDASGQRVKLPYRVRQKAADSTPVTEPAQKSRLSASKRLREMPQSSRDLVSRYNREELYEKVWAQPIQKLAKEYGVSDVALAKAYRRRKIPVPGLGYWAKKALGNRCRSGRHCPGVDNRSQKSRIRSFCTGGGDMLAFGASLLGTIETHSMTEQFQIWLNDIRPEHAVHRCCAGRRGVGFGASGADGDAR